MVTENFSSIINDNNITNLAIGRFDGMHIAHQKLFGRLSPKDSAILVIDVGYSNLTPHKYKQKYTNIPIIFVKLETIKEIDGLDFISTLKTKFKNLEKIVVGYDFRFGKNRKYDIFDLNNNFDGIVEVIDEVKVEDIGVHSKAIREYIANGNFDIANKMLGRKYSISGQMIKGQGLGKEQFVPTINIQTKDFLLPKEGVYATKTIINNHTYNSATFVGHRVSTDNTFAIETHILEKDIDGSLVDFVDIFFITKIRDNKKFDNFDELKKQILLDLANAKDVLNIYDFKHYI